jgi:CDP-glucose 4,6-dehydratase
MGTIHVLEAARLAKGLRAVVIVTSDKCYENREWPWPYREQDPMGGYDPYSSSKGCAELVTAAWRQSFFAPAEGNAPVGIASARAGNVIGGGDWAADRLVPDAVRAFGAGDPLIVRSPRAVRPWQHVLEPLSGYLSLAEHILADPRAYSEAWNFGPTGDGAMDVAWVVERLVRAWGKDARWELDGRAHPHEAHLLQVDASKARARLGWRPRLPLAQALDWTVEWYRRVASGESAHLVCLEQIARYDALEEERSA